MSDLNPAVFSDLPESNARAARPRTRLRHNPFYLLSAACMLASCVALTNSMSWTSIGVGRLLTLIATLNVYEIALLAIALYLAKRRGHTRDAKMLLGLQLFFMADFAFVSAELVTADLRTGLLASGVLLVLATMKLGAVAHLLRPNLTRSQLAFVLLQLALVAAIPWFLRWIEFGRLLVGAKHFYAAWWAVGLMPTVYAMLRSIDWRLRPMQIANVATAAAVPARAYLVLPFVSLLVHVGILHYVYTANFLAVHATPLLLGLTVVIAGLPTTSWLPRSNRVAVCVVLPAIAVVCSSGGWLRLDPLPAAITPLRLAVVAAYLVYVYSLFAAWAGTMLLAGLVAALAYVFGPSRADVGAAARRLWDGLATTGRTLTPTTRTQWGAIGVVASFVLLIVGFRHSLRKRPGDDLAAPSSGEADSL